MVVIVIGKHGFPIGLPYSAGLVIRVMDFLHKVLGIVVVIFLTLAVIVNHGGQTVQFVVGVFESKIHLPFIIEVKNGNPCTVEMRIVIEKDSHVVAYVHRDAIQFHGVNILVAVHFFHQFQALFPKSLFGFFPDRLRRGRNDATHQGCK